MTDITKVPGLQPFDREAASRGPCSYGPTSFMVGDRGWVCVTCGRKAFSAEESFSQAADCEADRENEAAESEAITFVVGVSLLAAAVFLAWVGYVLVTGP